MFNQISATGQTLYAELLDQLSADEKVRSVEHLQCSFVEQHIDGKSYWYINTRSVLNAPTQIYLGPNTPEIREIINCSINKQKIQKINSGQIVKSLTNFGFNLSLSKHLTIIRRIKDCGFFHYGGMLIGTHAFVAYGNMFGVKWSRGHRTMDVDFAYNPYENVTFALPNGSINVASAIDSLKMGFLPNIVGMKNQAGASYRSSTDSDLRIDFVTSGNPDKGDIPVRSLNISLTPLKFMEYLLEKSSEAIVLDRSQACLVSVPEPARFACHKLIISGERSTKENAKKVKDLAQVASIFLCMHQNGWEDELNDAWQSAYERGKGWSSRLDSGLRLLKKLHPELIEPVKELGFEK